jgi:hypothetical protein
MSVEGGGMGRCHNLEDRIRANDYLVPSKIIKMEEIRAKKWT